MLAADTDGIDGVEDNAGAIVTPDTLARAAALGLKAAEFLDRNDAYNFFDAARRPGGDRADVHQRERLSGAADRVASRLHVCMRYAQWRMSVRVRRRQLAARQTDTMLDDDVIEHVRAQADAQGIGYQTLINALLRKAAVGSGKAKPDAKPLTVTTLRRVLREELQSS